MKVVQLGQSTKISRQACSINNRTDACQATGYGLSKADFQARMEAMVYNLRCWVLID